MKKIGLLFALVLLLAGCAGGAPTMEDYTWRMTTVNSMEDGQALARGEGGTPDSVQEIVLLCSAQDGALTLTDETNGETCTGTYRLSERGRESTLYEISLDGEEGIAVVSVTKYQDDSEKPTMILSTSDVAITFFSD